MNSIGVVGCGFVGQAVAHGMAHAFEVWGVDKTLQQALWHWNWHRKGNKIGTSVPIDEKKYGLSAELEVLVETVDGPIFVCVPTPMRPDGTSDTSIVETVVADLDSLALAAKRKCVIVVKSTVPPGTTDELNRRHHSLHVCFNPEFLREATATEDFKNQDRIILGGPHVGTKALKQMYQKAYPDVPTTKTHSTIAEMVKYMTNCFLANKVSFANEIYQICEALEIDYDKVVEYATKDHRLGNSHWAVPGPDGHFGYGLACLPKDINGLIARAKELNVTPTMLQAIWDKNLEVRPERDWEQLKGRAVSE